ncbi:MAG: phosphatidate cytidylyltransferase [Holosporales bacterium]|jgi:phosphatidate cytidylyltransferase|nr:phosphatidate cytidylyltransferase [Holosporales bacterium]
MNKLINNNIKLRTISALCIVTIVVLAIIIGLPYFHYLISIISGFIFFEWVLISFQKYSHLVTFIFIVLQYFSFYSATITFYILIIVCLGIVFIWRFFSKNPKKDKKFIGYLGEIYIFFAINCLGKLFCETNFVFILWLFCTIWLTDTMAFFCGKIFGQIKLAPKISPGKTLEGLVLGTFFSVLIISFAYYFITQSGKYYNIVVLTVVVSISAHIGDLIESAVKRYFNVKDSGSLIPGHGGFADRFDSLLFVSIVMMIIVRTCL